MKIVVLFTLLASSLYFSQEKREKLFIPKQDSIHQFKPYKNPLSKDNMIARDSIKYSILVKKPKDSLYLSLVKKTLSADAIKILTIGKEEKIAVKDLDSSTK